jgi:elongation factor G
VNEIVGGSIPREYIPAVQKGFDAAMVNGPLAGFNVDSMRVRLFDGSFHAVDSDSLSFEICARTAFREAARSAGPVLLEPVMKMEISTPPDYLGEVVGDLQQRRGLIERTEARGAITNITALAPLKELFGYSSAIRSLSQGRAGCSMEPHGYQIAPQQDLDSFAM